MTRLETIFLDAGGVLVFPNWYRVSETLRAHGVHVGPDALAAAEPHAKRHLDQTRTIQATNDTKRGWLYFNLILERAGVAADAATDAALAELHAYHQASNLWELVPGDVRPSLRAIRELGLRTAIVSNANGTFCAAAERLGITPLVTCVLDSQDEGVEKPDPRLFEIALERSGADRETTIHVGDIYEVDVVGARAAGIRPVLLDTAGLYPDADCHRVQSLAALLEAVQDGLFGRI